VLHREAGLRGLLQGRGDDGACPLLALRADEGLSLLEFLRAGAPLGLLHEPLAEVADQLPGGSCISPLRIILLSPKPGRSISRSLALYQQSCHEVQSSHNVLSIKDL
jgi:hypothetical protein